MMLPDPAKRIRMEDILEDAWFQQDLPPGTLEMNRLYLQQPVDNAVRFTCYAAAPRSPAWIGLLITLMAVRVCSRASSGVSRRRR